MKLKILSSICKNWWFCQIWFTQLELLLVVSQFSLYLFPLANAAILRVENQTVQSFTKKNPQQGSINFRTVQSCQWVVCLSCMTTPVEKFLKFCKNFAKTSKTPCKILQKTWMFFRKTCKILQKFCKFLQVFAKFLNVFAKVEKYR